MLEKYERNHYVFENKWNMDKLPEIKMDILVQLSDIFGNATRVLQEIASSSCYRTTAQDMTIYPEKCLKTKSRIPRTSGSDSNPPSPVYSRRVHINDCIT